MIADQSILARHDQLEATVGFLQPEYDSLLRSHLFSWIFFPILIAMATIQAISFILYNGPYHPLAKILDGHDKDDGGK